MGFSLDRLRKDFPHLAEELEKGAMKIPIDSVRVKDYIARKTIPEKFKGYIPDVIDFIRRCSNEKEAKEIIEFIEGRGEISHDYSEKLLKQLKEMGVRSFGPKKKPNYYFNYFVQLEKKK